MTAHDGWASVGRPFDAEKVLAVVRAVAEPVPLVAWRDWLDDLAQRPMSSVGWLPIRPSRWASPTTGPALGALTGRQHGPRNWPYRRRAAGLAAGSRHAAIYRSGRKYGRAATGRR